MKINKNIELNINKILKELKKTMIVTIENILKNKSNLAKDSQITFNESKMELEIFLNDYVVFIESGRKARVRKVPITALAEWAGRKGINANNSVLFAIQNAIYNNGIPPRDIIEPVLNAIQDTLVNKLDYEYKL
jgi:hypothetical protein